MVQTLFYISMKVPVEILCLLSIMFFLFQLQWNPASKASNGLYLNISFEVLTRDLL